MNKGIIHRTSIVMLFGTLLVLLATTLFATDKGPLKVVYDVAVNTPEAVDNVLARASHLSNLTGADPLEGSIVLVLRDCNIPYSVRESWSLVQYEMSLKGG